MAHDADTRNQFVELRARGWSFSRIAKNLNVSKQTLINWSKELHCEIANLRNIELEALQECYANTIEHRLKMFGQLRKKAFKELNSRDLSQIKTPELVKLFLSLTAAIGKEQTLVNFRKKESLAKKILEKDFFIDQWPG